MSKSAQSRAAEVCRKLGLSVDETENGVAYQIILDALQKHEADTRYACGEAVFDRASKKEYCMIDASAAHATCMNAKVE